MFIRSVPIGSATRGRSRTALSADRRGPNERRTTLIRKGWVTAGAGVEDVTEHLAASDQRAA